MEIYLTELELSREENLFKPHEVVYVIEEEDKKWDIRTYKPKAEEEEMPSVPTSC